MCGSWPSLTSVSFGQIDGFFLADLMNTLRLFPIRRLRFSINDLGTYFRGFGPELVSNILTYLPGLEELVLDHYGNTVFSPLPGTMVSSS